MKHFKSLVAVLLSIPAASGLFEITFIGRAAAQVRTPCLPTHTTADLQNITCTVGAETYGITIYKLAICTNNPMSSSAPDLSSCKNLFDNPGGQYVDLGTSNPEYASIKLRDFSDPQERSLLNGVYNYVYLQIGTTWNIKAKATVSTGTWYTSSALYGDGGGQNTATQNVANFTVFPNVMTRFGSACEENNDYGGKGALLTSTLQPITYSSGACPGASYTALSANTTSLLGSPVSISDKTKKFYMKFKTTESSIGLWAASDGTYVFGSLGFQLNLSTIE